MRWLAVGLFLAVAGCGQKQTDFPPEYTGEPGHPVALDLFSDTPAVEVSIADPALGPDFRTGLFLVDTGSPVTLAESAAYPADPGLLQVDGFDALAWISWTFGWG